MTHENGERIVSYQVELRDGTLNVRHNFPDALVHRYSPSDLGEDVPLFSGQFHLEGYADPFQGDVRWRWGSIPRIGARGTKEAGLADVAQLFVPDKPGDLWVPQPQIVVDLPGGALPPQPASLAAADDKGQRVVARIEERIGEGTDLTQVRRSTKSDLESCDTAVIFGRAAASSGPRAGVACRPCLVDRGNLCLELARSLLHRHLVEPFGNVGDEQRSAGRVGEEVVGHLVVGALVVGHSSGDGVVEVR